MLNLSFVYLSRDYLKTFNEPAIVFTQFLTLYYYSNLLYAFELLQK